MRLHRISLTCALLLSFALTPSAHAEESDQRAYLQECSKCHGLISTTSGQRHRLIPAPMVVALAPSAEGTKLELAVALPFGPNLTGIYGRAAGSVADFSYSEGFLSALEGRLWDEQLLDEYLTDSRARAPGARMYYRQPDARLRALIIDYLKRTSGG